MKGDNHCFLLHVGVSIDTADKPYPSLISGYFRNKAATAKTLSKDGWLMTGDIGCINANNIISIIDQRKNSFKLSSGEYINFTHRITVTFSVYQSSKSISAVVVNTHIATLSNISHNISKQQPKYVGSVCKIFHLCFCFFVF